MNDTHRIEIEIDGRRFEALQGEASRLGLDVSQLVVRAASAWLYDITDSCVAVSAVATAVAQ